MKRPDWAAHAWAAGDWLYLELPAIGGLTHHHIRFPLTEAGLRAAATSLRSRGEMSKIGTKGDPTEHQVEKLIAEYEGKGGKTKWKRNVNVTAKMKASAREILKARGMI